MSKNFLLFFIAFLSFVSCSEYGRVVKSTDAEFKFTKAVEYYESKEYFKALPIFEELIGITRGTDRAEEVYYYYAKCHYGIKDYYLANYYFKQFTKTYSTSRYAEECLFLAAMCSYKLSPDFSLDQTETKAAIDEFQLFLDRYPNSANRDTSNYIVSHLNTKLELKDFEVSRLYVKTEKYKSGIQSLKDFQKTYPNSSYKEEAMYLIVKAAYQYALNSIESKQAERFRDSVESYTTFATAFPESKWLKEAAEIAEKSNRALERLASNDTQ
ncbi:MAG: outer membrane protein assembly factor BamD [Flavobacteriales bacterium]|nr:outer membrane protein assembly factor BamD [Flavobacteriales bacterium]